MTPLRRSGPAVVALLALLPLLATLGCSDSSSPTEPDGGPLAFTGTVTSMGTSVHDLAMPDDGLLRITLTRVDVILFDITIGGNPSNLSLGIGLGQRNAEGECDLTSNFFLRQGQLTVFRLSRDDYCVTIFDPGTLPEDAVIGYRLELEITI